jgi:hypothetical protein
MLWRKVPGTTSLGTTRVDAGKGKGDQVVYPLFEGAVAVFEGLRKIEK